MCTTVWIFILDSDSICTPDSTMQWINIYFLFIWRTLFVQNNLVFRQDTPEQLRLSSLIKGSMWWLAFEVTTVRSLAQYLTRSNIVG